MRAMLVLLALLLPIAAHGQQSPPQSSEPVTIFAAASLTDVMKDLGALWQQQGHPAPRVSLAASSTLARQIEQGAPANIFASADEQWMDYLAKRNLIVPDTRKDLLRNDLVLVVPAGQKRSVAIGPGLDLAALLGPDGRLAVGDPAHVPAGIYAEQALKKLGLWNAAQPRLAPAEDVRGALLLVERGEAPAGIVYGTDAAATTGVAVAGIFPPSSHDPILYPFAVVKSGDSQAARDFLAFLQSPAAMAIFGKRGFGVE
jgi:molybdate transport system substrate-binding protein